MIILPAHQQFMGRNSNKRADLTIDGKHSFPVSMGTVYYLIIIPRARVGYERIDGYSHLISKQRKWNNCFINPSPPPPPPQDIRQIFLT